MKTSILASTLIFCATLSFAATVLELKFPAAVFNSGKQPMGQVVAYTGTAENFVPAGDGTFAYVHNDADANAKIYPRFAAHRAFPYAAGSIECTFKVLKQVADSKVRLVHVFSPAKETKEPLIYYFYIAPNGSVNSIIQVQRKQYRMAIPARLIKAEEFNTVKMEWNKEALTLYLAGKKYDSVALPPEFAAEAALPRDWSEFFVEPVIVPDGDNWENRVAISYLKVEKAEPAAAPAPAATPATK